MPAGPVTSQVTSDSIGVSVGAGHNDLPLTVHKHWQVKWEGRWGGVSVTCVIQSLGEEFQIMLQLHCWRGNVYCGAVQKKFKGIQHYYSYSITSFPEFGRSGLEHLTCADSPKENWKLLLPLSRDESPLPPWECSLSWHFWVGDGCWRVICEMISQF